MEFGFKLLDKENVGSIKLGDKVRVSDPCYDVDTWCAGTLENVLPGEYQCFTQRVDMKDWGVRIANTEVRHKNYLDVEPTELQDIDVGVDSGQCGIYDLEYFIEARKDKHGDDEWYDRVCDITDEYIPNPNYVSFNQSSYWKPEFEKVELVHKAAQSNLTALDRALAIVKDALGENLTEEEKEFLKEKEQVRKDIVWDLETEYWHAKMEYRNSTESQKETFRFATNTLDNKCLVSSSGDGDGSYHCFVGRSDEGKIISIKIDYYYGYDEEDGKDAE